MNQRPKRIPIPLQRRLQDARLRLLPALMFVAVAVGIGFLWRDYVAAPSMVGQAEPVVTHVSSYKPGMLAELNVSRFQRVKAGDVIGQVVVTDPKILASTLALIRSEIEMMRVSMDPIANQQRTAMDYNQLQLNWMRDRAQLASAQLTRQLAETEFQRIELLYQDKIIAGRMYDQAKAAREKADTEVRELTRLVAESEQSLRNLQLTNAPEVNRVTADPLTAAINVQNAKLRLTEDELSPITLRAPMDGVVSSILLRSGEAVAAGQPIVAIASETPVRIVGYLRPPIINEPKLHGEVEVRTRGVKRQVGLGKVMQVGAQLEAMPVTMMGASRLLGTDVGLPVDVSLPSNLVIRPGEIVDLTFLPEKR